MPATIGHIYLGLEVTANLLHQDGINTTPIPLFEEERYLPVPIRLEMRNGIAHAHAEVREALEQLAEHLADYRPLRTYEDDVDEEHVPDDRHANALSGIDEAIAATQRDHGCA